MNTAWDIFIFLVILLALKFVIIKGIQFIRKRRILNGMRRMQVQVAGNDDACTDSSKPYRVLITNMDISNLVRTEGEHGVSAMV